VQLKKTKLKVQIKGQDPIIDVSLLPPGHPKGHIMFIATYPAYDANTFSLPICRAI
jgi:hypothetical protein